MHADGWVILSFVTIACGYAFGVRVPKPMKARRRNDWPRARRVTGGFRSCSVNPC